MDPRTIVYATDFVVPLATPPTHPSSVRTTHSTASHRSSTSTAFRPLVGEHSVPPEILDRLCERLLEWRETRRDSERDMTFISSTVNFPDKQLSALVAHAPRFLQKQEVEARGVLKVMPWESATTEELDAVAEMISSWCMEAAIHATPKSQRRTRKKPRTTQGSVNTDGTVDTPIARLPAPVFTHPQTPTAYDVLSLPSHRPASALDNGTLPRTYSGTPMTVPVHSGYYGERVP